MEDVHVSLIARGHVHRSRKLPHAATGHNTIIIIQNNIELIKREYYKITLYMAITNDQCFPISML